ncbi:MAG: mechanosensitive ion channel [Gammaproteobacteria bacterium]|nr:mechanosensitive ion channel [Gammaproteobacteria bacterium]
MIAILLTGYLASKFVERLIERRLQKTDVTADAAHALKRISFYILIIIIVMTALGLLHIPLTAFAFISGAVAIGVGFGAQNIINNFISGWILMFERPVRIGDFIELDDRTGVVEEIGNRSTRIRRSDGVHMLVPNSQLLERKVVNWTLVDLNIRSIVRVGVAYGSPTDQVAVLVRQAVDEVAGISKTPAPQVIFEDFGDSALIFDVYFWAEMRGEKDQRSLRSEVRFRIDQLFRDNDIVIAFPQQDVHIKSGLPIDIHTQGSNDNASGSSVG